MEPRCEGESLILSQPYEQRSDSLSKGWLIVAAVPLEAQEDFFGKKRVHTDSCVKQQSCRYGACQAQKIKETSLEKNMWILIKLLLSSESFVDGARDTWWAELTPVREVRVTTSRDHDCGMMTRSRRVKLLTDQLRAGFGTGTGISGVPPKHSSSKKQYCWSVCEFVVVLTILKLLLLLAGACLGQNSFCVVEVSLCGFNFISDIQWWLQQTKKVEKFWGFVCLFLWLVFACVCLCWGGVGWGGVGRAVIYLVCLTHFVLTLVLLGHDVLIWQSCRYLLHPVKQSPDREKQLWRLPAHPVKQSPDREKQLWRLPAWLTLRCFLTQFLFDFCSLIIIIITIIINFTSKARLDA